MRSNTAGAGRDPARNLQVVLGGMGLLFFAWSWANFSGPVRLFVDLQLRFLGRYSEPAAAVASAVVVIVVVGLIAVLVKRAYPGLSATAADAVVSTVFVVASIAALWQVGELGLEAARMPRLSDPVQVVDLGTLGNAGLPIGHVHVIGAPDRTRQVLGYTTGRYGLGGYWEIWVPLISRAAHGPDAPARIVATARRPDRIAATRAVAADPEGLLLFDSVDTRTIYEARQEGLDMAERAFALYPEEGVRFDKFTNAVLLGSFVVLFWALAAHRWITDRRSGVTPTQSPSARPSDAEPAPVATAAPPNALTPPPGAALLCVLRDEPTFSSPSYKRVDVDGVRVADLQANRYTVVALWPGPHTLAVNTRVSLTSDTVARFDLAAGDVVVYRLKVPFFGPLRLERTSDVPGVRAALTRLKPVESA